MNVLANEALSLNPNIHMTHHSIVEANSDPFTKVVTACSYRLVNRVLN